MILLPQKITWRRDCRQLNLSADYLKVEALTVNHRLEEKLVEALDIH